LRHEACPLFSVTAFFVTPQAFGDEGHQRGIGLAVHRRCGQPDLQCVAIFSGGFGLLSSRLSTTRCATIKHT
jgi:hypothetical protein